MQLYSVFEQELTNKIIINRDALFITENVESLDLLYLFYEYKGVTDSNRIICKHHYSFRSEISNLFLGFLLFDLLVMENIMVSRKNFMYVKLSRVILYCWFISDNFFLLAFAIVANVFFLVFVATFIKKKMFAKLSAYQMSTLIPYFNFYLATRFNPKTGSSSGDSTLICMKIQKNHYLIYNHLFF